MTLMLMIYTDFISDHQSNQCYLRSINHTTILVLHG